MRKHLKNIEYFIKIKEADLKVFLVFLCISLLIWFFEKLRQTYTLVVEIPVVCTNVPDGYSVNEDDIEPVRVQVTTDGATFFWRMATRNRMRLPVSVSTLRRQATDEGTAAILLPKRLSTYMQEHLPDHVDLKNILTDSIRIPLLTLERKLLPVVVEGTATLAQQHMHSAPMSFTPKEVWVSGTSDLIDTMTAVYVHHAPLTLHDTISLTLPFALPSQVGTSASGVELTYYVEPYTEKQMDVPITAVNLPDGYSFKAFPSSVHVTFNVGMSHFEQITAADIDIVADLATATQGNAGSKIRLLPREVPLQVQNMSYNPVFVEYLLEKIR